MGAVCGGTKKKLFVANKFIIRGNGRFVAHAFEKSINNTYRIGPLTAQYFFVAQLIHQSGDTGVQSEVAGVDGVAVAYPD